MWGTRGRSGVGDARQQNSWSEADVLNPATLLWGLLFGSIGLGFFIYGKKQRAVVPLVCGLGLMIYPYFVGNHYLLVGIGVVLTAIPYFLRY
jgi:hypothetical protein